MLGMTRLVTSYRSFKPTKDTPLEGCFRKSVVSIKRQLWRKLFYPRSRTSNVERSLKQASINTHTQGCASISGQDVGRWAPCPVGIKIFQFSFSRLPYLYFTFFLFLFIAIFYAQHTIPEPQTRAVRTLPIITSAQLNSTQLQRF